MTHVVWVEWSSEWKRRGKGELEGEGVKWKKRRGEKAREDGIVHRIQDPSSFVPNPKSHSLSVP